MKVERKDNEFGMLAHVYPFGDDGPRITVERSRGMGNLKKWEEDARVGITGFGPVVVEVARPWGEGILEACRIAEEMNAVPDSEHTTPGGYMVEYRRGDSRQWVRIENGADVEMWDGWTVAKVPPSEAG